MIAAVHRLYGHPFDRRDASIRPALAAPDPYRGPKGRARPRGITRDDLVQLFPSVARRPDPTRTRDLALFCLGYATGLTAPELAMLQADSVIGEDDGGLTVICLNLSPDHPLRTGRFRLEPTDDPFCAVAAIKRLKFETRNESQPLFRSTTDDAMPRTPGEITAIIRGRVRRAGLDPRRITDRSFLYGWKALAAEYIAETRVGDDEATENRAA
jgi:integrase